MAAVARPTTKAEKAKKPRPDKSLGNLFDRQPPCDLEAERAVLGGIMLKPDVCDDVIPVLRPDDFFDPAHEKIYGHLVRIHEDGRRIDPMLLVDRLRTAGELEMAGGTLYIAELNQAVPTAANAVYYADIVREKSVLRSLIAAGTEIVHDAYHQSGDSDHLLGQAEQKIFSILERGGTGQQAEIREVLQDVMERIDARLRGDHVHDGVDSGFTDFDNLCGGLHNGELIILAARPSMGKTALALNIAEYVSVELSMPVLFVSLEMSKLELGNRLLCSRAKINGHHVRNNSLSSDESRQLVESAGELSQAPLVVDDTPTRTVSEIAAVARRMKRRESKLGMIVIDYLQLIEPDNPLDPRQEQVAKIARRLKHMARELNVPVLCLAQLNRQAEDARGNRPRLSHLRESGAIEQDADVVLFVHREDYFATSEEEKSQLQGQALIIVAKQRNGPTGEIPLTWLQKFTRFENAARPEYSEFGGGF